MKSDVKKTPPLPPDPIEIEVAGSFSMSSRTSVPNAISPASATSTAPSRPKMPSSHSANAPTIKPPRAGVSNSGMRGSSMKRSSVQ